ncbi:hypothetical protein ACSQ67_011825 [Phaseolus vulgaris]
MLFFIQTRGLLSLPTNPVKGHFPCFDMAYEGFTSGNPERGAKAIRVFVEDGHLIELDAVMQKNMGLDGQRVECLSVLCEDEKQALAVHRHYVVLAQQQCYTLKLRCFLRQHGFGATLFAKASFVLGAVIGLCCICFVEGVEEMFKKAKLIRVILVFVYSVMKKHKAYAVLMGLELASIEIKYGISSTANPFQQLSPTTFIFLVAIFCHALASIADSSFPATIITFHVSGVVGCETLLWLFLAEFLRYYIINAILLLLAFFFFFHHLTHFTSHTPSDDVQLSNMESQETQI